MRITSFGAAILALTLGCRLYATAQVDADRGLVNAQLPWHAAELDSHGKLVPWFEADKHLGFDKVLHLAWDYIEHQVKIDPKTGQKVYLTNAVFDANTGFGTYWQHNPASTYAQFVDSVVAWYPYSGDKEAVNVARSMLDYQLARGTTPANWDWASVPFATSCGGDLKYGKCMKGLPRDFYGGIETDKVGELGVGYVLFYELTGEKKYLVAGIACAEALAKHIRPGDESHTPWAFRVNAKTGDVLNGEEYGGMIVAPVRLFAELVRLQQGDVAGYEASRKTAWSWIKKYPLHNNKWSGYFEDVARSVDNDNQASPTMTAYYILTQADPASVDPEWTTDVGRLIDWVKKHYGRGPYFGAWAIDEQGPPPDYSGCCSRGGLASATSRWAAVNALYYEKANDGQAQSDAFRSLSYATYFAADDGKIACCGLDYVGSPVNQSTYWFDDGYGDYIRNLLWALGGMPELAPKHEDHLLQSSCVVQLVEYGRRSIHYRTYEQAATETLRLSYKPATIKVGGSSISLRRDLKVQGYTITALPDGDYLLRVRHTNSDDVQITG